MGLENIMQTYQATVDGGHYRVLIVMWLRNDIGHGVIHTIQHTI